MGRANPLWLSARNSTSSLHLFLLAPEASVFFSPPHSPFGCVCCSKQRLTASAKNAGFMNNALLLGNVLPPAGHCETCTPHPPTPRRPASSRAGWCSRWDVHLCKKQSPGGGKEAHNCHTLPQHLPAVKRAERYCMHHLPILLFAPQSHKCKLGKRRRGKECPEMWPMACLLGSKWNPPFPSNLKQA